MKANKKFLIKNDRGDVGVGTLIIFIAMVLVAAVAATVLIYTTGALQQKATKTSKEATQQISSNIIVDKVIGNRSDATGNILDNIQSLEIRIKPDVGTASIDLRQVIISITDKNYTYDRIYGADYSATAIRDADSSFSPDIPVLNSGDLIAVNLNATALGNVSLGTRKYFTLVLNQETGASQNLEITTPNSFGVNKYIDLYP